MAGAIKLKRKGIFDANPAAQVRLGHKEKRN